MARKSALSSKAKEGAIMVLDDINFEAPKTKDCVAMTSSLKINDKKTLIILSESNKNVYLSARNLPNVKVLTVSELSTYKILDCSVLVLTEAAVAGIEQHFNV